MPRSTLPVPRPVRTRVGSRNLTGAVAVLAIWAASRYWGHAAGVRFDASNLRPYHQFLDVELLRDRLLQSLWYLHYQPPLFNLLLGVGLKLPAPETFWWAVFLVLGASLHVGLFVVARALGLPIWASVLTAGSFAAAPESILYESWLFYNYPAAAFLVGAVAGAAAGGAQRRWGWLLCFGCLAALPLTLSFFNPWAFFLPATLGLVLLGPAGEWRRRAIIAIPAVAVALSPTIKNLVLFGSEGGALGMTLARIVASNVPMQARRAEVAAGTLSPASLVYPFQAIDAYPPAWRAVPPATPDVPVLRRPLKFGGVPNFNYAAYLPIARADSRDSIRLLREYPAIFAHTVRRSWWTYLIPATEFFGVERNRARIAGYTRAVNRWFYGMQNLDFPITNPTQLSDATLRSGRGLRWALAVGLALVFGIACACRDLFFGERSDRRRGTLLAFMAFAVLYVTVVGNLLENGENNRFRLMIDPLLWLFVAFAIAQGARWLARLFATARPARSSIGV